MTGTKHGGCADCGAKDEPILTSVMNPEAHLMSKAVCSKCFPKYAAQAMTR